MVATQQLPQMRVLLEAAFDLPQLLTEATSGERGEFSLKNLSAHSVHFGLNARPHKIKRKKAPFVHCVLLPAAGILPESQTRLLAR